MGVILVEICFKVFTFFGVNTIFNRFIIYRGELGHIFIQLGFFLKL